MHKKEFEGEMQISSSHGFLTALYSGQSSAAVEPQYSGHSPVTLIKEIKNVD